MFSFYLGGGSTGNIPTKHDTCYNFQVSIWIMSNYDDRNQKNEMKFTKPNTVTTDKTIALNFKKVVAVNSRSYEKCIFPHLNFFPRLHIRKPEIRQILDT